MSTKGLNKECNLHTPRQSVTKVEDSGETQVETGSVLTFLGLTGTTLRVNLLQGKGHHLGQPSIQHVLVQTLECPFTQPLQNTSPWALLSKAPGNPSTEETAVFGTGVTNGQEMKKYCRN